MKKRGPSNNKGQIWVSAVLYIALGMVVITLILSAGIPLINKMRDKNTVAQSKRMMFSIDENIRAVANEGPGSKRFLSPLDVSTGFLTIDNNTDSLTWKMETTNKMFEEGIIFEEGPLFMWLDQGIEKDLYEINLQLNYSQSINLSLITEYGNPFQGRYSFSIRHTGRYPNNIPMVDLNVV